MAGLFTIIQQVKDELHFGPPCSCTQSHWTQHKDRIQSIKMSIWLRPVEQWVHRHGWRLVREWGHVWKRNSLTSPAGHCTLDYRSCQVSSVYTHAHNVCLTTVLSTRYKGCPHKRDDLRAAKTMTKFTTKTIHRLKCNHVLEVNCQTSVQEPNSRRSWH